MYISLRYSVSIGIPAMIQVYRVARIVRKRPPGDLKISCCTTAKVIDPYRVRGHLMPLSIIVANLQVDRFGRGAGVLHRPAHEGAIDRMLELRMQYFDRLRP